jgi:hypothetical protein
VLLRSKSESLHHSPLKLSPHILIAERPAISLRVVGELFSWATGLLVVFIQSVLPSIGIERALPGRACCGNRNRRRDYK